MNAPLTTEEEKMRTIVLLSSLILLIILLPFVIRADWRFNERYQEIYGTLLPRYRFLGSQSVLMHWRPPTDLAEPQQDAELDRLRKAANRWLVVALCLPIVGVCCAFFLMT